MNAATRKPVNTPMHPCTQPGSWSDQKADTTRNTQKITCRRKQFPKSFFSGFLLLASLATPALATEPQTTAETQTRQPPQSLTTQRLATQGLTTQNLTPQNLTQQNLIPQDLIAQGRYIAAAADCAACHSMPGAPVYSGGYAFQLPIGTLYSSNITPDKTHGIGTWTEAQFVRAIRQGVRPDGTSLYPAMPFPSYARMTDADLHALYVYFMQGVKPVAQAARPNTIPWPLSMRFPLTLWRRVFAPTPEAARKSAERSFASPELARGAYLVEGPGHCGACHTKRGMAMQEKALSTQDGPRYLAGGDAVDDWVPPSLRGELRTGLGAWSEEDLTTFLRTGRNTRGSAFGNMDAAIHHGTQYLTDYDLTAIARYLKALPPADGTQPLWQPNPAAARALQAGGSLTLAQRLYLDNCATCHRSNGAGYAPAFPPLAGNPVVQTASAASLIHIVLTGATLHGTATAPSSFTMPGFSQKLTDAQIAAVITFIRQSWGNNTPAVREADVAHLRQHLHPAGPSPAGHNTSDDALHNAAHPAM